MEIYDDEFEQWMYELRDFGLEYVSRRYYSMYQGLVISNKDPQEQGRVLVKVEELGHSETLGVWAYPAANYAGKNYGNYFPAEESDLVWIWFHLGDPSQPRYSGGWWINPDQQRKPATSYVPEEFKRLDGLSPTTRGIKTKQGNGLLFEDDTLRGKRLELWTGEPTAAIDGINQPATRHHQLIMSDETGKQRIEIKSNNNNTFILDDQQNAITSLTAGQRTIAINDTTQTINIATPSGQSILISDGAGTIDITATGPISTTGSAIAITALTGDTVMTGAGNFIKVFAGNETSTVNGFELKNIVGAQTLNVTGAKTVTVAGAHTEVVAGAQSVTVAGVQNTTYSGLYNFLAVGLALMTFSAGLTLAVSGVLSLGGAAAAGVTILCGVTSAGCIALGSLNGIKLRMMDERFLAYYNSHTHLVSSLGAPTAPPTHIPQVDTRGTQLGSGGYVSPVVADPTPHPLETSRVTTYYTEAD